MAGSTAGCGTVARYIAGCRCEPCTAAKTRADKRLKMWAERGRTLWVPRRGTVRRLQALRALGWPTSALAHGLGSSPQWVSNLMLAPATAPVHIETARRVAELYDELSMRPGPSTRSKRYGVRHGWLPPLAWDDIDRDPEPAKVERIDVIDEAAVLRKMRGENVRVTHEERREAVRRLHAQGMSDGQITRLTGINGRQVLRDRQRLGLAANDMGQVSA